MRLLNLKKVPDYQVENWLEENIAEITKYQKERIHNDEIVRFAPFEFYERRKRVDNFLIRLSIIFLPIVWLALIFGLPFNFIGTGTWGYKKINWFSKWTSACGV